MSVAERFAEWIGELLKVDPGRGRRKLATVIMASNESELAKAIRFYFNRQIAGNAFPANPLGKASNMQIDRSEIVQVIGDNLSSTDPERAMRAADAESKLDQLTREQIRDYCRTHNALMGFGLSSFTGPLKKAAKAVKKAAKKVKKHDFKKDIAVLNKVGKVIGPIAAAAPPPYGPAIAGGLMILDAADKYNKGAIDQIDASKLAATLGLDESENVQEILKAAQNVQNNIKATDLIAAVTSGDVKAIAKMKGIKALAQQGNKAAKGAYSALKAAKIGVKLDSEQKKTLAIKAAPRKARVAAILKASQKIETPQGTINIIDRHKHGAALLLNAAMAS